MAGVKHRPDWKAIEDQMRLYAFRAGTPPDRAALEARAAVKEMKAKYQETGEPPERRKGFTK